MGGENVVLLPLCSEGVGTKHMTAGWRRRKDRRAHPLQYLCPSRKNGGHELFTLRREPATVRIVTDGGGGGGRRSAVSSKDESKGEGKVLVG